MFTTAVGRTDKGVFEQADREWGVCYAEPYAGGGIRWWWGRVYSAEVDTRDVAWLDVDEGQMAKVEEVREEEGEDRQTRNEGQMMFQKVGGDESDNREIGLSEGLSGTPHTQSADFVPTTNNSISAAKLLENIGIAEEKLQGIEGEWDESINGNLFYDHEFTEINKVDAPATGREGTESATSPHQLFAKVRENIETAKNNL